MDSIVERFHRCPTSSVLHTLILGVVTRSEQVITAKTCQEAVYTLSQWHVQVTTGPDLIVAHTV